MQTNSCRALQSSVKRRGASPTAASGPLRGGLQATFQSPPTTASTRGVSEGEVEVEVVREGGHGARLLVITQPMVMHTAMLNHRVVVE
eukprot:2280654-Pyramimonas_sp.AAC.1